jgi:paraquat-inducible protein B
MVHSAICVIFPTIISMIYVDIDTEYDHSLLLVSPVHFWSHQGVMLSVTSTGIAVDA